MVHVYAVGDDFVFTREGLADITHGRRGNRDAAVEPTAPALDDRAAHPVKVLAVAAGVKGADVNGVGVFEDGKGEDGGHRLVQVDDVVLLALEERPYPAGQPYGEGDACDGTVAGQGNGAAQRNEQVAVLTLA